MKQLLITVTALVVLPVLGVARCSAQSMGDLNLQVHGYATQGFVYSTNNNWNTTDSTNGSAAWTEAVVNITAQPQPKVRIGVQARYYLLGNYGNKITVDWAEADVKINEKFGLRVGKVKAPLGLLNETQDIDPSYPWILLPQSIYPLASRNALLSHNGGVIYGKVVLGESLGSLDYRVFGGQHVIGSDDGYLQPLIDAGFSLPNGVTGSTVGGSLRWSTPVRGWILGATESSQRSVSGALTAGPYQGTLNVPTFLLPYMFSLYENRRLMLAAEYSRFASSTTLQLFGAPPIYDARDQRCFYVMASYKLSDKLTGGIYYSGITDHKGAFFSSAARYQKDWTLSGRYDFNPYLYLKVEQHIIDGTQFGYSKSDNSGGLKPDSRMTLLKLGVSF